MGIGNRRLHTLLLRLAWASLICTVVPSHAVDNPDAPNRLAEFETRALAFEQSLAATDGGSAAARAGQRYEQFLDSELNAAYRALLAQLRGPAREALIRSQRQWIQFRDLELKFIDAHWTPEKNGTSYSLSVAQYRATLVKGRIAQLLRYSAEYR